VFTTPATTKDFEWGLDPTYQEDSASQVDPDKPADTTKTTADNFGMRQVINVISSEVFQATLITYLLLGVVEIYQNGSVTNFVNVNYILLVVLISGVACMSTNKRIVRDAAQFSRASIHHAKRALSTGAPVISMRRLNAAPTRLPQKAIDSVRITAPIRITNQASAIVPAASVPVQATPALKGRRRSIDGFTIKKNRP
jgi:hypothetical protein